MSSVASTSTISRERCFSHVNVFLLCVAHSSVFDLTTKRRKKHFIGGGQEKVHCLMTNENNEFRCCWPTNEHGNWIYKKQFYFPPAVEKSVPYRPPSSNKSTRLKNDSFQPKFMSAHGGVTVLIFLWDVGIHAETSKYRLCYFL